MLCQFTFWNYKTYRDEVTLNFIPARISEHTDRLLKEVKTSEEFLPLAVLYGPNGGGKSTVIESFRYLRAKVLDLRQQLVDSKKSDEESSRRPISFTFDDEYSDLPTGWSVSFITKGFEYKYTLSMVKNLISSESLYTKELSTGEIEMLFERDPESIKLGGEFDDILANKVNAELPLISFISKLYQYQHADYVTGWFKSINVIDYSGSTGDRSILIPGVGDEKTAFFKLLNSMGIQIDDLFINEDSDGKIKDIFSVYRYKDKEYYVDYYQESSGTMKVFSFLTRILKSLKDGCPIFIDELDAKLHPKLLEFIISLFTNPKVNVNGAQLIITSHDLHTMNNKLLRRDEIWFAAKRDDFSSYLYSLSDFKKISSKGKQPRSDENYAKQYIEGRYGADPYFQRLENWTVAT